MQIVSAREFRANQGKFLTAAREGQSVLLTSRYGNFKITPVTDEDALMDRINQQELKSIQKGLEDIRNGRTYRMQVGEDLSDFLNRIEPCIK